MQDAPPDLDGGAQRAGLDHANRLGGLGEEALVVVEDVDIPGVPVDGAILKGLELVGERARRQDLALRALVVEARDVARGVDLDADEGVLQQAGLDAQGHAASGVGGSARAPAYGVTL